MSTSRFSSFWRSTEVRRHRQYGEPDGRIARHEWELVSSVRNGSEVGITARFKCPERPFLRASISWRMARASPTMRRAQSRMRSPSGVKHRNREPRSTIRMPNWSSTLLSAEDEGRLGHAHGFRRPPEMTFAREGQEEFELIDHVGDWGDTLVLILSPRGPAASVRPYVYAVSFG